jgi:hypothetical protein
MSFMIRVYNKNCQRKAAKFIDVVANKVWIYKINSKIWFFIYHTNNAINKVVKQLEELIILMLQFCFLIA